MNPSLTFATAGRVLTQLRRDHRTLGMIIVIPCVLITLIKFVVSDDTWARIRRDRPTDPRSSTTKQSAQESGRHATATRGRSAAESADVDQECDLVADVACCR